MSLILGTALVYAGVDTDDQDREIAEGERVGVLRDGPWHHVHVFRVVLPGEPLCRLPRGQLRRVVVVGLDGHKARDADGNHLTSIRVSFDIAFPEGPDGDAARDRVQAAIEMSRDRLCTVSRTVQLGADVVYDPVS